MRRFLEWLRDLWAGEPPYYFFHIPKTAGSSLRFVIEQQFPPEQVCQAYFIADALALAPAQLARYRLFRGHFSNLLFTLVPRARVFTFLRDPVDRALSHYQHVYRNSGHPLFHKAREQGNLHAYLEDPVTRGTVANYQARSLVWQADARALAARFTTEQLTRNALEAHLDADMLPHLPPRELLERAIERLETFAFVGLTEQFGESLARLFAAFRWGKAPPMPREHVAPVRLAPDALDARERDLLDELNEVDRQLYDYAERRFGYRLRIPPRTPSGSLSGGQTPARTQGQRSVPRVRDVTVG